MEFKRREVIEDNVPPGSMLEEAYYGLSELYGDILSRSLGLSSLKELAEATKHSIRHVTVLGAGPAANIDVMALLSLFTNRDVHIDITDINPEVVADAQDNWNMFVSTSRRDLKKLLGSSSVTFRVANAYFPSNFRQDNDLTIMRNVGSGELTDNPDVNKTKFVSTGTAITRPGGLMVMTALSSTEIEGHVSIMSSQPVTILYEQKRPATVVYTPSDIHAIVARKN